MKILLIVTMLLISSCEIDFPREITAECIRGCDDLHIKIYLDSEEINIEVENEEVRIW